MQNTDNPTSGNIKVVNTDKYFIPVSDDLIQNIESITKTILEENENSEGRLSVTPMIKDGKVVFVTMIDQSY
jgi:hypothetical protein